MNRRQRVCAAVIQCGDCEKTLTIRPTGFSFGGGYQGEWFMVKDRVWQQSQRNGSCRFLCVECLEDRIGRKLLAEDFRSSAKVNFVGEKSDVLRRRMRGLKPAKRLINTTFTL